MSVCGGSYDMGGVWRPDYGSAATVHFDHLGPYNHSLYSNYYTLEDDYYGAYGDLLEYERALRLAHELSEGERLRRWRQRMEFEELEHTERMRRYQHMSEIERSYLGLGGRSWWASRYGQGRHAGWRQRFGDRLSRWTADRLPLSSVLGNRFGGMWGANNDLSRASGRVHDNLNRAEQRLDNALYRQENRLASAMNEQDRYLQRSRWSNEERALQDAAARQAEHRLEQQLNTGRLEHRMEEDRLECRLAEDRLDRRLERDQIEDRFEADRYEARIDDELRYEARLDTDRLDGYLAEDYLEDRLVGDRFQQDERILEADTLYREDQIKDYERERGFDRSDLLTDEILKEDRLDRGLDFEREMEYTERERLY